LEKIRIGLSIFKSWKGAYEGGGGKKALIYFDAPCPFWRSKKEKNEQLGEKIENFFQSVKLAHDSLLKKLFLHEKGYSLLLSPKSKFL
jgi:hypothetical protein